MKKLLPLLCIALFPIHAVLGQKLDMEVFKEMKPRSIGPAGMSGRITAIDAVVRDPSIIYAGAASGGVWKSTSGGITWEPVFDKEAVQSIGAIAIQQDNPSVVWVGTGEGNPRNSLNGGYGIYKSLDAGKTWKLMGLEKTRHIHRIVIDPKNPNTVYVAAIGSPWGEHPERGVYKTTDGGQTWQNILFVNERTGCAELVMDPSNPNKLIAAMWEHRRWPWTFKSGGPGSGIYITYDGGKNWKKLGKDEGLPDGELGRTGLAISRSKPDVVYALVESSKNALYRSDDGGNTWKSVNEDRQQIGTRPFYYHEIYVDPQNENRVYTIYSEVNVSEDGGKSFQKLLPYYGVHPDHHAWWINPENPSHIIEGNDGGLNISYDMGKTWRFAENIPVGQFYHINVDMEHPYNIYGGMQDNGSWTGPAYVWRNAGIRNSYWQEVSFGDGFDVSPDPDNSRYGYTMSQGGNLLRFDKLTGHNQSIRPTHPDPDMRLRFNWNSALAQDPHDNATIYYGSQFLHKSTDKGNTWEIISPDLTTNNKEKQRQHESGGLTIDATGAENHCTILAIAPSPVEKGVIWVGTDDGNVQVTRDGGKTWTNVSPRINGMPANAWVPQIKASTFQGGEAFVVVNNYRQFDYKPYLFRTKDYGATWESLVTPAQVGENNYTLAFVQDPVARQLFFLGTENGLWVSVDEGKNWTRWTAGFPVGVPVMDLVIHPREHDLVIGTFGRSIYVLDDIRPLREIAMNKTVLSKTVHLFDPPEGYQTVSQQPAGIRFDANAMFNGENRPRGALLTYVINRPEEKKPAESSAAKSNVRDRSKASKSKEENVPSGKSDQPKVKFDSLVFEVFNSRGEKIRTIRQKAPEKDGVYRTTWDMNERGVRAPSRERPRGNQEPSGLPVLPGEYKIRVTFGNQRDSAMLKVNSDPRFKLEPGVREQRYNMLKELERFTKLCSDAVERLKESKEVVEEFEKRLKGMEGENLKEAREKTKAVRDSINAVMDFVLGKEIRGQGEPRSPDPAPVSFINRARYYIQTSMNPVGETDRRVFSQAEGKVDLILERVNGFYDKVWPEYRSLMEKVNLSPFKDYAPLKR